MRSRITLEIERLTKITFSWRTRSFDLIDNIWHKCDLTRCPRTFGTHDDTVHRSDSFLPPCFSQTKPRTNGWSQFQYTRNNIVDLVITSTTDPNPSSRTQELGRSSLFTYQAYPTHSSSPGGSVHSSDLFSKNSARASM